MKATLVAVLVLGCVCFIEAGRMKPPHNPPPTLPQRRGRSVSRPPMNPPPNLPTRRGRSIYENDQFLIEMNHQERLKRSPGFRGNRELTREHDREHTNYDEEETLARDKRQVGKPPHPILL